MNIILRHNDFLLLKEVKKKVASFRLSIENVVDDNDFEGIKVSLKVKKGFFSWEPKLQIGKIRLEAPNEVIIKFRLECVGHKFLEKRIVDGINNCGKNYLKANLAEKEIKLNFSEFLKDFNCDYLNLENAEYGERIKISGQEDGFATSFTISANSPDSISLNDSLDLLAEKKIIIKEVVGSQELYRFPFAELLTSIAPSVHKVVLAHVDYLLSEEHEELV